MSGADEPAQAMGLAFANPVGLAAGFDRTGAKAAALGKLGFGHIEIGTVFSGDDLRLPPPPYAAPIGANIASARPGLGADAVEDFAAAFRAVQARVAYVCANLSSPFAARDANSPGVERLIGRLAEERDACGLRAPLLVKLRDDGESGWPAALVAVRRFGLDGVVFVSADLQRIAACSGFLEGAALVSAGGVCCAADVQARLAAGAALVQIYSVFERKGAGALDQIRAGLHAFPKTSRTPWAPSGMWLK